MYIGRAIKLLAYIDPFTGFADEVVDKSKDFYFWGGILSPTDALLACRHRRLRSAVSIYGAQPPQDSLKQHSTLRYTKNSKVPIVFWRETILAEGLSMSVLYSDAGT
jgi:hypothetical protein